ncbi:MAG: hypothetical protein KIT69_16475, partial [Propionibacteriaceae bacterium]|nr:hypothetical protein [Propionibacteriaceae bacterium]
MMLTRGIPCSPGRGTGALRPSGDARGAGAYVVAIERVEAQHTALLRDPRCTGVIATRGSPADHFAILARESALAYLTIPGAAVDAHGLTTGDLRSAFGTVVTVDATAGVLYRGSRPAGTPTPDDLRAPPASPPVVAASGGTAPGTTDKQGNRYWSVDAGRLLPVYRDLYERIFAARLRLAGVAGFVRRDGNLLVYGGPDQEVTRRRPAAVARQRLLVADHDWISRQDRTWRGAARTLEATISTLRHRLVSSQPSAASLAAVFDAKVSLNALGVDSMLPGPALLTSWLAGSPSDVRDEVVAGCYLPASGDVTFDAYETESLVLARDTAPGEEMPRRARARFVQNGLFYRHDALDPAHREWVLFDLPREAAEAMRRSAPDRPAITAALRQVSARPEHRSDRRRRALQQV